MRGITVIKRNSATTVDNNSLSETAGLAPDTKEHNDVDDAPATRRTGNGEGRTDKETQAKNAEKARNSGIE